jgi:hypothetical protein
MADNWSSASDDAIDGRLDTEGSANGAAEACIAESGSEPHCG